MAYTPELSQRHSAALRRIAWALGLPMTKTLEAIFDNLAETTDGKAICEACRDRSLCPHCIFGSKQQVQSR